MAAGNRALNPGELGQKDSTLSPMLKYNPPMMRRRKSIPKFSELQARHALIRRLAEREKDPVKLRHHQVELRAMAQQLRELRVEFLRELSDRQAS